MLIPSYSSKVMTPQSHRTGLMQFLKADISNQPVEASCSHICSWSFLIICMSQEARKPVKGEKLSNQTCPKMSKTPIMNISVPKVRPTNATGRRDGFRSLKTCSYKRKCPMKDLLME